MRQTLKKQPSLVPTWSRHQHSRELETISKVLDAHPEIAALAEADVVGPARSDTGREGLSGDQVVRALLIKQIHGLSYEELAFHLDDSRSFRSFGRLSFASKAPSASTLQRNVKSLRAETLASIHRIVVDHARQEGIEKGRTVRADCTVVATDIHAPTDSSLLFDCVRVITRLLGRATKRHNGLSFAYADHTLRAKRRTLDIQHAKSARERKRHYRELIEIGQWVDGYATAAIAELDAFRGGDAQALVCELREVAAGLEQVLDQTRRRVLLGQQVPADQKVVSLFEPHTDIIKKARRETQYGHKIWLCGGKSGLITDVEVLDGNPADSTLAETIVERQHALYGRAPRQVAFDGGFTSRPNLETIKQMGVKDVAFHKKRGLKISEMAKSAWVFKRLRDFRAGIEGVISTLKRVFGLDRCTWKGLASFKAYVHASVLAFNLVVLARHLLN